MILRRVRRTSDPNFTHPYDFSALRKQLFGAANQMIGHNFMYALSLEKQKEEFGILQNDELASVLWPRTGDHDAQQNYRVQEGYCQGLVLYPILQNFALRISEKYKPRSSSVSSFRRLLLPLSPGPSQFQHFFRFQHQRGRSTIPTGPRDSYSLDARPVP